MDSVFNEVFRAEYRRTVAVATALTGSAAIGEEIAQEAFLAAARRWREVSALEDPAAWVRRVATNRAVSVWRRHNAERRARERLGQTSHFAIELSASDAELWAAVRRLPRRQAQIVVLVYVGDLTLEQSAAVLGIATPTAKTHLQRARERLAPVAEGWRTSSC